MFRDRYTNFSFDEISSETMKVWLLNSNDLVAGLTPNVSDSYETPTQGFGHYLNSTTADKNEFKLKCIAVNVTLNEWRAIQNWLSPFKVGRLKFDFNKETYFEVKVSSKIDGTLSHISGGNRLTGDYYMIEFTIAFTTIVDFAALGYQVVGRLGMDFKASVDEAVTVYVPALDSAVNIWYPGYNSNDQYYKAVTKNETTYTLTNNGTIKLFNAAANENGHIQVVNVEINNGYLKLQDAQDVGIEYVLVENDDKNVKDFNAGLYYYKMYVAKIGNYVGEDKEWSTCSEEEKNTLSDKAAGALKKYNDIKNIYPVESIVDYKYTMPMVVKSFKDDTLLKADASYAIVNREIAFGPYNDDEEWWGTASLEKVVGILYDERMFISATAKNGEKQLVPNCYEIRLCKKQNNEDPTLYKIYDADNLVLTLDENDTLYLSSKRYILQVAEDNFLKVQGYQTSDTNLNAQFHCDNYLVANSGAYDLYPHFLLNNGDNEYIAVRKQDTYYYWYELNGSGIRLDIQSKYGIATYNNTIAEACYLFKSQNSSLTVVKDAYNRGALTVESGHPELLRIHLDSFKDIQINGKTKFKEITFLHRDIFKYGRNGNFIIHIFKGCKNEAIPYNYGFYPTFVDAYIDEDGGKLNTKILDSHVWANSLMLTNMETETEGLYYSKILVPFADYKVFDDNATNIDYYLSICDAEEIGIYADENKSDNFVFLQTRDVF